MAMHQENHNISYTKNVDSNPELQSNFFIYMDIDKLEFLMVYLSIFFHNGIMIQQLFL